MSYDTPNAFRMALEQRLLSRSNATGLALDRLGRRVVFERIVARLHRAEPGRWVLKGGMALEVRLRDNARLTKDIDLGHRDEALDADELRDRLVEALGEDPDGDRFVLTVGPARTMVEDGVAFENSVDTHRLEFGNRHGKTARRRHIAPVVRRSIAFRTAANSPERSRSIGRW